MPAKTNSKKVVQEKENKKFYYVKVKFEHKEKFKALFPETLYVKGKGWQIEDTLSNHRILEDWYRIEKDLGENEIPDAIKKITEGLTTIAKKVEALEMEVKKKKNDL